MTNDDFPNCYGGERKSSHASEIAFFLWIPKDFTNILQGHWQTGKESE